MEQNALQCGHCGRKAFRSPTNRCMYCGMALPEKYRFSTEELAAYKERHVDSNMQSEAFASGMGKPDFQLQPGSARKPRRKKGLIRRIGAFLLAIFSGNSSQ